MKNALPKFQARLIYDVLEQYAGASPNGRDDFIYSMTHDFIDEYRFMGSLGFGGKFWRSTALRPDGSYGEVWYVNTYREYIQQFPEAQAVVDKTNEHLQLVQFGY